MKAYLAGHVPKGKEEENSYVDWRIRYSRILKKCLGADSIDPFDRNIDESDLLAIFGHGCKGIKESDLVVVNAEGKLGVGTSQEIVIAKYFRKPVIVVLPKDSFHRRSDICIHNQKIKDWIHPFIYGFADFIIESIDEIKHIKDRISSAKVKDITEIDKGIKHLDSLN